METERAAIARPSLFSGRGQGSGVKVKIVADTPEHRQGAIVDVDQVVAVRMLNDGAAQPVVDRPDRAMEER